MSKLQHEVAALKKQPKPPAAAETPEKLTSRRTSARCSTTAAGSSSTPRGVSEDGGNRGLNTSGEISARRTTSRSASRLRNRDARQPAAAGTRSTTLPSASSSPSACCCHKGREAALFEPLHSASGLSAALSGSSFRQPQGRSLAELCAEPEVQRGSTDSRPRTTHAGTSRIGTSTNWKETCKNVSS